MNPNQLIKHGTVWGVSLLLGVGIPTAVSADVRPIFKENPATLEQYFGPYWSRLTTVTPGNDRHVTYTYSPGEMRSLFLNADNLRLSVEFVNDQAQRIKLHQDGMGFDLPEPPAYPDYYPTRFNALFEYVFGDRPPPSNSWPGRPIYDDAGDGGTLHRTTYCMAQDIAISYEWISTRSFVHFIEIVPESRCS